LDITPERICALQCFGNKNKFYEQYQDVRLKKSNSIDIPFEQGEYEIKYAPVGNYTEKPQIIICGKTASGGTHDMFIKRLQAGFTLHEACFASIYSNMRENLYTYLYKIGLFEYLSLINPYWQGGDYKSRWNAIFDDLSSSLSSRIQLTQAFNCAILNKDAGRRSSEPKKKVFQMVDDNIGCLFKHFHTSEDLRLIIFLDTPFDKRRFHQSQFWRASNSSIPFISITHPSRQNVGIYNNLENWQNIRQVAVRENAKILFEKAKNKIHSLISEYEHSV